MESPEAALSPALIINGHLYRQAVFTYTQPHEVWLRAAYLPKDIEATPEEAGIYELPVACPRLSMVIDVLQTMI